MMHMKSALVQIFFCKYMGVLNSPDLLIIGLINSSGVDGLDDIVIVCCVLLQLLLVLLWFAPPALMLCWLPIV